MSAVFSLYQGFLTLKRPGGRIRPPRHFFVISQPVVIFSRWNLMTFFFKPCARFKTIFFKNRTGVYEVALRNRALGPTKNWPKTDFQWKLHTNRVFCIFLFQDTLSLCFIWFIWFIWSKNMCKSISMSIEPSFNECCVFIVSRVFNPKKAGGGAESGFPRHFLFDLSRLLFFRAET